MKIVSIDELAEYIAKWFSTWYDKNKTYKESLFNPYEKAEDISFAYDYPHGAEHFTEYDCSSWYFAKLMSIPEYESDFILIDYCGGGSATCASVVWSADDDDFIAESVKSALLRIFNEKDMFALQGANDEQ